MNNNIYIGTSGWSYGHWKGVFYPEAMQAHDYLEFYQQYFNSVEINNTFYHLPETDTFRHWHATVADDFVYSVKASRYITHMKKLISPGVTVVPFMDRVKLLADKLGMILFQLPPHWHCNPQRLELFLASLPAGYHYVFEFRDASWFNKEIYRLLKRYHATFCIYDLEGKISPMEVTSAIVYLRLHGPSQAYSGCYKTQELMDWAAKIAGWYSDGKQVFCYFNNDEAGYAVKNALELKAILACD